MTQTGDKPHPIQPLVTDHNGVLRFKKNAIVRWLLDDGPFDLNMIAVKDFSREDQEQFAQLIGYSHSGAHDLSYVTSEVLTAAERMHEAGESEVEARNAYLRETLKSVKGKMAAGVAELYGLHEEDLLVDDGFF